MSSQTAKIPVSTSIESDLRLSNARLDLLPGHCSPPSLRPRPRHTRHRSSWNRRLPSGTLGCCHRRTPCRWRDGLGHHRRQPEKFRHLRCPLAGLPLRGGHPFRRGRRSPVAAAGRCPPYRATAPAIKSDRLLGSGPINFRFRKCSNQIQGFGRLTYSAPNAEFGAVERRNLRGTFETRARG